MAELMIRSAVRDDITTIVQYAVAMVGELETMGGYQAADKNDCLASMRARVTNCLENDEHLYLIAEYDTHAVGLLEARCIRLNLPFRDRLITHISCVYVDPSYRQQGVGQALMQTVLIWGRQRGVDEFELNVLAHNSAKRLYEKLGFEIVLHQMVLKS